MGGAANLDVRHTKLKAPLDSVQIPMRDQTCMATAECIWCKWGEVLFQTEEYMNKSGIVIDMQFFMKNVMGAEPCQIIGVINHQFDEVVVFKRLDDGHYVAQPKHIMKKCFENGLYLTNKTDA